MAQSPFQTSGSTADIAPVQLKGGFSPDTGIADAVVDVANIALPAIRQNLEDDLTNDVTGRANAVSLALKATRFPSIQSSVFSEEALANPNVAMALEEFTLIQDAAKQGRLPATFALERLELIQNNAIRNAPEFEAELRGAMRDATGQDPQKALFSKLLQETTNKTAEQKAFEQLTVESIKIGVSVDQLIGMNQTAALNKIEQDKFDLAAKQGTYTLNTVGSETTNRGAALVTDIMADVQRMNTAGQAIGVDEQASLISKVNASFGAASAAIMAKTANLSISGSALSAELKPLETLRDNTIAMIEDGTMTNLLKRDSALIVADAQNTFLNNPEYGKLHAVLGTEGTLKFMEFKGKYGNNPQAKALALIFDKRAGAVEGMDAILQQASRVGDGAVLETAADKQARVLASASGVANIAAGEEYQLAALEDIKKYGSEELAWSNFSNNQVLTATAASNKLKAAFINMQVATTAGLSIELIGLAGNSSSKMEQLQQREDGSLFVNESIGAHDTRGVSSTVIRADADMHDFVKRFNRANSISAKYSGAGVLPSSRYSGSVDYWNTINKAARGVVQPQEEADVKVIKYIRDADGGIVLSTEGS